MPVHTPPLRSFVAVLCLIFAACGSDDKSCDDIFVSPFSCTVVDEAGHPVHDAKVTYTRDGGASKAAMCMGTMNDCSTWYAPEDTPGTYLVSAASADGTKTAQKILVVVSDGEPCPQPVPQGAKVQLTLQ